MLKKWSASSKIFFLCLVMSFVFSFCSKTLSDKEVKNVVDSLNATFALGGKGMPLDKELTVQDLLLHGKWLQLGVDKEDYFFLNLDPCDSTTIRTLSYEFTPEDLLENSIQSSQIYKIGNVTVKNRITNASPDQLFIISLDKSEFENAELNYSIIVEPIDDLNPERRICKFYKVLSKDTISFSVTDKEFHYFIPAIHLEMVNHKVTESCEETY